MVGKGDVAALLGMPGPWADDHREPSHIYTCKIGGLPDWPFSAKPPLLPPDLLLCSACGTKLCLVAQVYAPVWTADLKVEDRALLVFGCLVPECGNTPLSWRAVRIQRLGSDTESCSVTQEPEPSAPALVPVPVSKPNWLDDETDDEDMDLQALGQAFLQAGSQASHSSTKQTNHRQPETAAKPLPLIPSSPDVDMDTPVLPCFYLYTVEEPSRSDVTSMCANYSALSIKQKQSNDDDDHEKGESWEGEVYEYDKALTADRIYLKFKKRLDANPKQCFRYLYGGKPLLATADVEDPGTCKLCGCSRHYEMQLMPPLIYFLNEAADDRQKHALGNWDLMTLLVYTCSKSCSGTFNNEERTTGGWILAEEAAIVQFEKPLHESGSNELLL
ncbi:hypothetical protein Tsubulata_012738 [Turnera subulata]|uniref:Programmed cell death protein 2 C-terminal domain-containing protein n=1 Tax=Turnera subulata TaxID=218843 RepID=A0A9Q0GDT1_9ROSI|nr:hypothetical protein Tsubulata_012738 [Turnera subulata]